MGRLFFADTEADDETVHRLHDIRAEEVSIVDRAANRRRFLLLKRSEDMADTNAALVEDEKGNLSTDKEAEKMELAIPGPVREAVLRSATEALNRMQSFVNMVKESKATEEESKTPMPAKLGAELKAMAGLLGSIGEKYPSPMAKEETDEDKKKEEEKEKDAKKADTSSDKILAAIDELKKLLATPAKKEDEKQELDLSPMAKAFDGLAEEIKKQREQVEEIRKSHSGSKATRVDDGDKKKPFVWPVDMAEAVRKEASK